MSSSILSVLLVAVSLLVSTAVAQTTTWGICFTSSSLPNSPYGPWSVATSALLQVSAPFYFNDSVGTPASAGGLRWAQTVISATGSRTQLNRDGTTSTATLTLGTKGVQGSDLLFFNNTPYTDWNGIVFQVVTSSDQPYPGSTNWIVYPNDFPTQQVELYYDLPTYNYPTEYHHDNQTNGAIVIQAGSVPSCTPAALTTSKQSSVLTFQFCYQAYAAAAGSVPAWQVAIQGTFLTQTSTTTSKISGQSGLYILYVSGNRTQQVGSTMTTTPIVGQTWHNSGGGDANEYSDDPLLLQNAPFLVPNYGLVFYMGSLFTYPNGTQETVDNYYAQVNADPLAVTGTTVSERQGPQPSWSGFAVSCSCAAMTCPLITSSSSAAVSGSVSTSCSSTTPGSCGSAGFGGNTMNAAAHVTLTAATLLLVTLATSAAMLM